VAPRPPPLAAGPRPSRPFSCGLPFPSPTQPIGLPPSQLISPFYQLRESRPLFSRPGLPTLKYHFPFPYPPVLLFIYRKVKAVTTPVKLPTPTIFLTPLPPFRLEDLFPPLAGALPTPPSLFPFSRPLSRRFLNIYFPNTYVFFAFFHFYRLLTSHNLRIDGDFGTPAPLQPRT